MKAVPRRIELGKRLETKPIAAKTAVAKAAPATASLHLREKAAPGFVERNPLLGFFPAGGQMGNVQDTVAFRAEQLGS